MINPLAGKVLIKVDKPKVETESGIQLALYPYHSMYTREIHSNTGTIEAIGKNCKQEISIGDYVYFLRWGASYVDEDSIIINESDIVLIMGKDTKFELIKRI